MVGRAELAHGVGMTSSNDPRVVVGLDDSDQAPAVLAVADDLAGRLRLPLDVVHSPTPDVFLVGDERNQVIDDARQTMARLTAGHDVRDVLVQPGPPAELLRASLSDGAVLGVVGARGRGPLRAALLGSVSGELTHSAPTPVVIVPPDVQELDEHGEPSIVGRLDGTSDDIHTLRAAVWMAAQLGGRLTAVNVRALPTISEVTTVQRVERALDGLTGRPAVRVETGDAIDQLNQVVDTHDATLIVVGSRGDSLWGASLAGLVAAAQRPVMAVSPDAVVPGFRAAPAATADVG